jgi:hypothetical protein
MNMMPTFIIQQKKSLTRKGLYTLIMMILNTQYSSLTMPGPTNLFNACLPAYLPLST